MNHDCIVWRCWWSRGVYSPWQSSTDRCQCRAGDMQWQV